MFLDDLIPGLGEMSLQSRASMSADDLYRLGLKFSTGHGAPLDYVSAHKFFNLAALKGSLEARLCRKEMAEMMSKDEIAAALKDARSWLAP